jgi:peptide/nickel transport system permease protein
VIGGCLAFLGFVVICALAGPLLAPHNPDAQDLLAGIQGSSATHPLGTDDSGRDILSRVVVGARGGIVGPILIAVGQIVIGTLLGLLAGYRGGWSDAVISRAVDLMYALPALLVAIVLVGVFGGGYYMAVALLVLIGAPSDIRIVRGATLEQRPLPYVDAARTLGLSSWRIMFRHILPNLIPVIVATIFLKFAYALVALSALSFLGLGVDIGAADWGRMLYENLPLLADNPYAALAPGALIVLTALAMNLLGDWLYERLSDRARAQ